jgi:hypothetical protein
MKFLVVVVLLISIAFAKSFDGKCRALVLSGAGSQGAYQAAVIQQLTNVVPNAEQELAYDVIAGVSAGSLNALGMAGYAKEDFTGGPNFILALWNSIPDYNAYGNWPGGILQGLFFKQGIFDFAPGVEWVTGQWGNNTVNKKVSFATVDANSATYTVYDYNATGTLPDDFIESAFASSSIPAVFEPTIRGDKTLIDGGVVFNIDIPSAVRRCYEIVDKESDIIIDMVIVGDHDIELIEDLDRFNTLSHFQRGREIGSFYNYMSDYRSSQQMFPDVDYRYLIHPSESLPGGFLPLDFGRSAVDGCFEVGRKDAENAVKLGHGVYGEMLLEFADRRRAGETVHLQQLIDNRLKEMGKFGQASE